MDTNTYDEAIECLNAIINYSRYMARSEDIDTYRTVHRDFDAAREKLINILKEQIDDSK